MLCCKQDIDLYNSRGSTAMYSGLPSIAATGRHPPTSPTSSCPAQGLHWGCPQDPRRPRTGRTSSGTGMCVVCTFDLFVCKVLCFQRVCFLFVYICLQYMHMQSELVVLCVVT